MSTTTLAVGDGINHDAPSYSFFALEGDSKDADALEALTELTFAGSAVVRALSSKMCLRLARLASSLAFSGTCSESWASALVASTSFRAMADADPGGFAQKLIEHDETETNGILYNLIQASTTASIAVANGVDDSRFPQLPLLLALEALLHSSLSLLQNGLLRQEGSVCAASTRLCDALLPLLLIVSEPTALSVCFENCGPDAAKEKEKVALAGMCGFAFLKVRRSAARLLTVLLQFDKLGLRSSVDARADALFDAMKAESDHFLRPVLGQLSARSGVTGAPELALDTLTATLPCLEGCSLRWGGLVVVEATAVMGARSLLVSGSCSALPQGCQLIELPFCCIGDIVEVQACDGLHCQGLTVDLDAARLLQAISVVVADVVCSEGSSDADETPHAQLAHSDFRCSDGTLFLHLMQSARVSTNSTKVVVSLGVETKDSKAVASCDAGGLSDDEDAPLARLAPKGAKFCNSAAAFLPDDNDLGILSIADLQDMCIGRGLPTSGGRAALAYRLRIQRLREQGTPTMKVALPQDVVMSAPVGFTSVSNEDIESNGTNEAQAIGSTPSAKALIFAESEAALEDSRKDGLGVAGRVLFGKQPASCARVHIGLAKQAVEEQAVVAGAAEAQKDADSTDVLPSPRAQSRMSHSTTPCHGSQHEALSRKGVVAAIIGRPLAPMVGNVPSRHSASECLTHHHVSEVCSPFHRGSARLGVHSALSLDGPRDGVPSTSLRRSARLSSRDPNEGDKASRPSLRDGYENDTDFTQLSVEALVDLCRSRSLSCCGTREALIDRLKGTGAACPPTHESLATLSMRELREACRSRNIDSVARSKSVLVARLQSVQGGSTQKSANVARDDVAGVDHSFASLSMSALREACRSRRINSVARSKSVLVERLRSFHGNSTEESEHVSRDATVAGVDHRFESSSMSELRVACCSREISPVARSRSVLVDQLQSLCSDAAKESNNDAAQRFANVSMVALRQACRSHNINSVARSRSVLIERLRGLESSSTHRSENPCSQFLQPLGMMDASVDFASMTLAHLRGLCKRQGIAHDNRKKAALVALLCEQRQRAAPVKSRRLREKSPDPHAQTRVSRESVSPRRRLRQKSPSLFRAAPSDVGSSENKPTPPAACASMVQLLRPAQVRSECVKRGLDATGAIEVVADRLSRSLLQQPDDAVVATPLPQSRRKDEPETTPVNNRVASDRKRLAIDGGSSNAGFDTVCKRQRLPLRPFRTLDSQPLEVPTPSLTRWSSEEVRRQGLELLRSLSPSALALSSKDTSTFQARCDEADEQRVTPRRGRSRSRRLAKNSSASMAAR